MKKLHSHINQFAKASGSWGRFLFHASKSPGTFKDKDGNEYKEIPFNFDVENQYSADTRNQVGADEVVAGTNDALGDFIHKEPEGDERVDGNHMPKTNEGDPEGSGDNSGDMQEPPEKKYRKNSAKTQQKIFGTTKTCLIKFFLTLINQNSTRTASKFPIRIFRMKGLMEMG